MFCHASIFLIFLQKFFLKMRLVYKKKIVYLHRVLQQVHERDDKPNKDTTFIFAQSLLESPPRIAIRAMNQIQIKCAHKCKLLISK